MGTVKQTLSELEGRLNADALTDDDKAQIERIYRDLLDKPLQRTNCRDCYRDAVIEIRIRIKNCGMEKSLYKLKNGVVLYLHDTGKYLTNDNITTEQARRHLSAHPDDIRFFSVYPADWNAKKEQAGKSTQKNTGKKKATGRKKTSEAGPVKKETPDPNVGQVPNPEEEPAA